MISAAQCRAARGLLDWTQADLSRETGLSAVSIRAFERGGEMREANRGLLVQALERAGVELITVGAAGAGVLLRALRA